MKQKAKSGNVGNKRLSELGCLGAIACALVFMTATNVVYRFLERVIISHDYGRSAWEQGLRVIDKRGNLSNGDSLGWPYIVLMLGTFVLSASLAVGTAFLISYLTALLKKRRPAANPFAKPRSWRELLSRPAPGRPRINHQVTASAVRIIAEGGEELGVYSIAAALKLVASRREDLVEIDRYANPPICQSIDYGKYRRSALGTARVDD